MAHSRKSRKGSRLHAPDFEELSALLTVITGRGRVSDKTTTLIMEIFRLVQLLQVECRPLLVHLHLSGSTTQGTEWMPLLDDALDGKPQAVRVLSKIYTYIHEEATMVFAAETLPASRKRKAVELGGSPERSAETQPESLGGLTGSKASVACTVTGGSTDDSAIQVAGFSSSGGATTNGEEASGLIGQAVGQVGADGGRRVDATGARPPLFPASAAIIRSSFQPPDTHNPSGHAVNAIAVLLDNSKAPVGDLRACLFKVRARACLDEGVSVNKAGMFMNKVKWWPRRKGGKGDAAHHPFHVITPSRLIPITSRRADTTKSGEEDVTVPELWPDRFCNVSLAVAVLLLLFEKQPGVDAEVNQYVSAVVAGQGFVAGSGDWEKEHASGTDTDSSDAASGAISTDDEANALPSAVQVPAKKRLAAMQASRSLAAKASAKSERKVPDAANRARAKVKDDGIDKESDKKSLIGASNVSKKPSAGRSSSAGPRSRSKTSGKTALSASKPETERASEDGVKTLDTTTCSLVLSSMVEPDASGNVIPYTATSQSRNTRAHYPAEVDMQLMQAAVMSFNKADPAGHAGVSVATAVADLRKLTHDALISDWDPPNEMKEMLALELLLVTEQEYEDITIAQEQVKFVLPPAELKKAKDLLLLGGDKVDTINIDTPSKFCVKASMKILLLDEHPTLLTYSTLTNMGIIHQATAAANQTATNIELARRVSGMKSTGSAAVLSDGIHISTAVEDMLDAFLKSTLSGTVFKFFSPVSSDNQHGGCITVGSDIRIALKEGFMTDAIIDPNLLILRVWCGENNADFYPLLTDEANAFIGCAGTEVSDAVATAIIDKIAAKDDVCAATQFGFMICLEQKHWVSAVVDVVDHKMDIYDSYAGLECTKKVMPRVVSRLKLFGQRVRDAAGRRKPVRLVPRGFHKKAHNNLKQNDAYNCAPFSFSRLVHAAHNKKTALRGKFGDLLRVYMVANVFSHGAKYRKLRAAASAKEVTPAMEK